MNCWLVTNHSELSSSETRNFGNFIAFQLISETSISRFYIGCFGISLSQFGLIFFVVRVHRYHLILYVFCYPIPKDQEYISTLFVLNLFESTDIHFFIQNNEMNSGIWEFCVPIRILRKGTFATSEFRCLGVVSSDVRYSSYNNDDISGTQQNIQFVQWL